MEPGKCTTQKTSARNARATERLKKKRIWKSTFLVVPSQYGDVGCSRTILTAYREGEKIVLEGEADQVPDQEPGDIIFHLVETEHETFKRAGADLTGYMEITLAEALCGFSRVILKHLDGRGIELKHPREEGQILRPNDILKVPGEGMPYKKTDAKGDLYLIVQIKFPDDGFFKDEASLTKLKTMLPGPEPPIEADTVDEVSYEEGDLDDFGGGDPRGGSEWVDEDEEGGPGVQCAQQ